MSSQPQTFTVAVVNYKDDPTGEQVTLHGLYADPDDAAQFAYDLTVGAALDFLRADVVPLRAATVADVVTAQHLDASFSTPTAPIAEQEN